MNGLFLIELNEKEKSLGNYRFNDACFAWRFCDAVVLHQGIL